MTINDLVQHCTKITNVKIQEAGEVIFEGNVTYVPKALKNSEVHCIYASSKGNEIVIVL